MQAPVCWWEPVWVLSSWSQGTVGCLGVQEGWLEVLGHHRTALGHVGARPMKPGDPWLGDYMQHE